MVRVPDDIDVEGFLWDFGEGGNVEHLARHEVSIADVEAVLAFEPFLPKHRRPSRYSRDGR
jgi:hypothetical protein